MLHPAPLTLRPAVALLTISLLAFAVVRSVLQAVSPAPAPEVEMPRAVEPPLTRHLLLVVIDGLRYDIATDPAKMPHFAAGMRRHTSGEIWASRVSMTSSAVLAYGTGQRGNLEQILRNIAPDPPPFDTWLAHARAAGLRLMMVGDPVWISMYGAHWHAMRPDPEEASSIYADVNPTTFRDARDLLREHPNFLIVHFITPDHQGHAYGIFSDRYTKHIRDYDRQLNELLDSLGPEWTVVVTSDHGAADTGTHGTDVDVQRRSPIYAYGPGIAPGVKLARPLDQADIASSLATLLGAPPAAHSRGHLLVEWLDLPDDRRARVACADAERALRYGRATTDAMKSAEQRFEPCARADAASSARIAAARATANEVDAVVQARTGPVSLAMLPWCVLVALLALSALVLVLDRLPLAGASVALLLGAVAVALVFSVERLPGEWPNVARAACFVAGNLFTLSVLFSPSRTAAWLEARPQLAAALVPGLLLATYTSNTQPQSYVVLAVAALFLAAVGPLSVDARPLLQALRAMSFRRADLIGLLLLVAVLFVPGTFQTDIYPLSIQQNPALAVAAATVAIAGWSAAHALQPGTRRTWLTAFVVCTVSLLVHSVVPAWLGRSAVVAFGVAAGVAALAGRRAPALVLGMTSFVWVARAWESLALVATLGVAELVGGMLARRRDASDKAAVARESSLASVLLLTVFGFALLYVQRVGITGSIDFEALDWGAGTFGDTDTPAWIVGSALVYKFVLAELLVLGALGSGLAALTRARFFGALVIAHVARAALLLAILLVCSKSFWTTLRVVGDLPFALTAMFAASVAWAACGNRRLVAQGIDARARPETRAGVST